MVTPLRCSARECPWVAMFTPAFMLARSSRFFAQTYYSTVEFKSLYYASGKAERLRASAGVHEENA